MRQSHLILNALTQPGTVEGLGIREWETLLCQARQSSLMASLYLNLREVDLLASIPKQVLQHFEWSNCVAEKQTQAVLWELSRILLAFAETDVPLVLLKGAAYVLSDLPPAKGRFFSDIDIIVPKNKLEIVEAAMMLHGWAATHHDEYDQRYYRNWMHELPPMQHVKRMTIVDIHHAILPETARLHPDSRKLLLASKQISVNEKVSTFAPVDMVLHSIVHLFHEGEFDHGLRDLLDIHKLLLHFSSQSTFWTDLTERANELDLARPLFYGLRYVSYFLHTEIPEHVIVRTSVGAPNKFLLALMDQLFRRALLPTHASCNDHFTGPARLLLFIRANWLRMPPLLLARHLFHKAFISKKEQNV